jgi:hypothetical protein
MVQDLGKACNTILEVLHGCILLLGALSVLAMYNVIKLYKKLCSSFLQRMRRR